MLNTEIKDNWSTTTHSRASTRVPWILPRPNDLTPSPRRRGFRNLKCLSIFSSNLRQSQTSLQVGRLYFQPFQRLSGHFSSTNKNSSKNLRLRIATKSNTPIKCGRQKKMGRQSVRKTTDQILKIWIPVHRIIRSSKVWINGHSIDPLPFTDHQETSLSFSTKRGRIHLGPSMRETSDFCPRGLPEGLLLWGRSTRPTLMSGRGC